MDTSELADEAVTNAKLAHVATDRIKGRTTAGTGDVEDLTAAQTKAILLPEGGILGEGELLDTSSGTSFNTTNLGGITTPKKVTIVFESVSLGGTDDILVQLGDSGGIETSSYNSVTTAAGLGTGGVVTSTSGFVVKAGNAGRSIHATMTIHNVTGNVWVASHCGGLTDATAGALVGGGTKTLSATLSQITVTRTGTGNFDGGQIRLFFE